MPTLDSWLERSDMEQKMRLANSIGSSLPSIRLAAKGYRTNGVVNLTPEFATRLADGIAAIGGDLPQVKKEDLCLACSTCEYQKRCNKP